MHLDELIEALQRLAPGCELIVYRSYRVLGDRYGRELPPECSLKRTGTAETAIGVVRLTAQPGQVTIRNRVDARPNTTWDHKLRSLQRHVREGFARWRR